MSHWFLNNSASEANLQKQALLSITLSFEEHLKMILNKVNKKIGLLRELNKLLPRSALLTLYKGFVRPYLDYDNIIYDHAYNATFSRNWN